jgi:glycosyltransferase involved in cell wall biosynthesis
MYAGLVAAGYQTMFAGQEDRLYPRSVLEADLIVGLAPAFAKLPRSVGAVKLLYAANTHVVERIRRQERTAQRWQLPRDETLPRQVYLKAYDVSDYLMMAENAAEIGNFVRHGVPEGRIYPYHNGVDTDTWTPSSHKHQVFTFVCWGSALGLRKGLPSLVKAWEQWYAGQEARLLLVGMSSATSDRLFAGRRRGVGRPGLQLELEGFPAHHPRAVELVRASHVGILPTLDDASPASVQEMAACGLPIITTTESGFDFPQDFCTYVTADDPSAIAAALDEWFGRRECLEPYGARARAYMVAHHRYQHFRQRFAEILADIARREARLGSA